MLVDIKKIKEDARAKIAKDAAEAATKALVRKLEDLEKAKQIVKNIEREVEDLEASIADGSFTG